MKDKFWQLSRMAAILMALMAFATSAWAGGRWHVGDVIVCFGGGTCQVLRPGGTPFLLDNLSDSTNVTSPGATRGVAINNTLHLLVTDDGGPNNVTGSTGANIVEYQIAGEDPSGNPVPHGVVTVFDGAGGGGSTGITAVALDSAGNMYSLNSNGSSPKIVEINAAGALVGSTPPSGTLCGVSQVASMDLSTLGTSAYVTSLGTIRNVTLSSPTCGLFANLGSGVTFYGVKDVPPNAISNCKGTCSANETVLVAATGFFDSNGNGRIDTNDVNVCTNQVDHTAVSCALLLDTGGPGLTSPPWQSNHQYTVGQKVLDQSLHVQKVIATSANGKSGSAEPAWNDAGGTTLDNKVTWQDQGTSVLARYPVTGQTSLQALSLDPLLATPTSVRKVSNFWMADSASGKFFHLDFAAGTPAQFTTSCTGCNGIQSIGVYGGEDAAQPALVDLQSQPLTGPGTTLPATFTFTPGNSDTNTLIVTGYNFINDTPVNIHGYASAINPASGFSDPLLTPTPPNNALISTPAAPCTVTTSSGQCVVWQLDNQAVTQNSTCATNPASCAFLGLQLEYPFATQTNPDFNVIAAIDEQYDVTDSVDTISHYTNSQVSLHNAGTVATAAACTYGSPLSPSFSSGATCLTDTRNTIPFKFQCTNLPSGETQANLLPFLHIVQFVSNSVEPLLVLNGTGGTTNYRFDTTGQQWVFNLNNPGDGQYLACTEDATHTVPAFCTFYNVQPSCP